MVWIINTWVWYSPTSCENEPPFVCHKNSWKHLQVVIKMSNCSAGCITCILYLYMLCHLLHTVNTAFKKDLKIILKKKKMYVLMTRRQHILSWQNCLKNKSGFRHTLYKMNPSIKLTNNRIVLRDVYLLFPLLLPVLIVLTTSGDAAAAFLVCQRFIIFWNETTSVGEKLWFGGRDVHGGGMKPHQY